MIDPQQQQTSEDCSSSAQDSCQYGCHGDCPPIVNCNKSQTIIDFQRNSEKFAQVLCDGLLMSVRAKLLLNVTTNFSYHYSHATMRDENQKHSACSCIFVNRQSWLQVLGLVLQIDDGSIYLSDLPTCTEITPYQLPKAKTTRKWLTRETFDKLQNIVWEKTSTAAVDPKHFKQGSCRLRFS